MTPLMARFLNPPARIGGWPDGLFNDGRWERESARLEAGKAAAQCVALIIAVVRQSAALRDSVSGQRRAA